MFRINLIVMAFLIVFQVTFSGGKSGFNFLTLGTDAKLSSLADAGVSRPIGIGAIYYNPASLSFLQQSSAMFTYRNWMVDGKFYHASFGTPGKFFKLALSLTFFSISDIEIRYKPGETSGKFSARDFSLGITVAPSLGSNIKLGLTTKYIFEKIFVDAAQTIAFDIGLMRKFNLSQIDLYVGASLNNFGFKAKYRNEPINPPTTASIGTSTVYSKSKNLKLYFSTDYKYRFYENQNLILLGAGFEALSILAINIGYGTRAQEVKSWDFGVGLNFEKLAISYAFSSLKFNLPNSHMFTLEFKI